MKILIVDDSLTMRRIIINNLKKAGYTDVLEAENGVQALEVLEKVRKIDVILLDWIMPEMSGLEFLKIVKSNNEFKDIPITMVSTEAEKELVVQAVKAGASGYIVKPITAESFKKNVVEKLNK